MVARIQTGRLQDYLAGMVVVALLVLVLFWYVF
jgi:hypothetical protein